MLSPSRFDLHRKISRTQLRRTTRRNLSTCGGATSMKVAQLLLAPSRAIPPKPPNGRPRFDASVRWLPPARLAMNEPDGRIAVARRTASMRACWKAVTRVGRKQACPLLPKPDFDRLVPKRPSIWVTRRRPNRPHRLPLARPAVSRPQARILFVDPDQVVTVARESGGVPFDIKDVELSHVGERCSSIPCSNCSGSKANHRWRASR